MSAARAQTAPAAPPATPPAAQPSPAAAPADASAAEQDRLDQAQLEQLLAPVALYPDALLMQMLMASTYPLEVVQAQRWLGQGDQRALQGDALARRWRRSPGIPR